MTALESYLRQALARVTRLAETARAAGAKETEKELQRLRLLEELIKEQMPYEDARSSARETR